MDLILMVVAFGALMYFLMIRPQQKRMKQHRETLSALAPGARVLLTSGVFATVRHLGERQAIVELAPGTEITIVKSNIARPVIADEEEFEFSDDVEVEVVVEDEPSGELEADTTFDPRGDGDDSPEEAWSEDMSPEELQRKFDDN